MPPMNLKNIGLGPAASDLGLGGALSAQLADEEERRRRLKEGKENAPGLFGDSVMGSAAMQLFGYAGGQK